MDMKLAQSFLQKLREQYLETEDDALFCENRVIAIKGEDYKLNVWQDFLGTDMLVMFQLKPNSLLSPDSYSIAIRYLSGINRQELSHSQLQDLGVV